MRPLFCRHCGTRLTNEQALFCEVCGNRIEEVDVIVRSVEHVQGEPDEHGNVSFVESVITVNKAVTAGAETFDLVNVPSIYEQLDITEAELDEALEELQK